MSLLTRHPEHAIMSSEPPLPLEILEDIATGLALEFTADPALAHRYLEDATPGGRADRLSSRVLATTAYDAWLLTWPPGSAIEPHDHGDSHGVFLVVSGSVSESRWHSGRPTKRTVGAGEMSTIPAGAVHDVVGSGTQAALSIHVYSPPLTTMRFYAADGQTIIGVEAVDQESSDG